jgi:hypothetical protein
MSETACSRPVGIRPPDPSCQKFEDSSVVGRNLDMRGKYTKYNKK